MNSTLFDITSNSYSEISIPKQYQNGIYPKESINCVKVYDKYDDNKGKLIGYFPETIDLSLGCSKFIACMQIIRKYRQKSFI